MFISLRLYDQEPYQIEGKDLIKWYDKEKQEAVEKKDTNLKNRRETKSRNKPCQSLIDGLPRTTGKPGFCCW